MISAHVEDLVDGYALHALDAREAARVRQHLFECAACARALAEVREVVAVLPATIDELAPRRSVKTRLLAVAQAEAAETLTIELRPRRLLPFRMNLRSSNPLLRWASLGMAVAFVIGLVGGVTGWALVLGDRLDKKDGDLGESRDNIEKIVESNKLIRFEGSYAGADVKAVLAVPDEGKGALIVVSDVPPATSGTGYHLWLFADGVARSAGVVTPNARGDIVTTLGLDVTQYDRIELDLQPVTASVPGGKTVVSGSLR